MSTPSHPFCRGMGRLKLKQSHTAAEPVSELGIVRSYLVYPNTVVLLLLFHWNPGKFGLDFYGCSDWGVRGISEMLIVTLRNGKLGIGTECFKAPRSHCQWNICWKDRMNDQQLFIPNPNSKCKYSWPTPLLNRKIQFPQCTYWHCCTKLIFLTVRLPNIPKWNTLPLSKYSLPKWWDTCIISAWERKSDSLRLFW